MTDYTFLSNSEKDTLDFAKNLSAFLQKGDIIVLTGELGAGKTKFTEGVLSYFNMQDEISSPTFTIVNEYKKNDTEIFHFDVYRLNNSSEFLEIGGEEYFNNGICIIEWGELIVDVLPKEYLKINFERDFSNNNIRKLKLHAYGKKYEDLLERICT